MSFDESRANGKRRRRLFSEALFRSQRLAHGLFVMGPQNKRDAAAIDHFSREPFEHALGRPLLHLAAAETFEATPFDFLLGRTARKDFRKPPQRFLETDRLIETVPESRVVRRGRQRPELDRPEAVDQQLLILRVLDLQDGEERRPARPRSVQAAPARHDPTPPWALRAAFVFSGSSVSVSILTRTALQKA